MSLLASLKPKAGSTHYQKRIGRGIGSGMGGTSTKGHKGQLARTGGTVRRGFEGGQTPLSGCQRVKPDRRQVVERRRRSDRETFPEYRR